MAALTEIDAQIAELRETLARVERDAAVAAKDITTNGLNCLVTVHSSHGEPITKPGINPAVKTLAAAHRTARIVEHKIAALLVEKKDLEKQSTPSRWARFAPKPREHEVQN